MRNAYGRFAETRPRTDLVPGVFASFVLACAFLALAGQAPAQDSVTITIAERAGVDRAGEYVSFGVPLPSSWNVTNVSNLRLRDGSGAAIPAQFEPLARWGSHPSDTAAPVKWVLIGYVESAPAGGAKTVALDQLGPGPTPATTIQIDTSTAGEIAVNTGAAEFDLNTTAGFNILNQATIGGQTLLQSLGATDAIAYAPAGASSIVAGGSPDFTPRTTAATVERSGPLCAVVRVEGSILDDSERALLDFTARLHFVAGSADVRLDFTVENNQPVVPGDGGQAANVHDQGSANSVYIGDMNLALRLRDTGGALRVLSEDGVDVSAPSGAVELYQGSSGAEHWNAYVGMVGWGTPESPKASANPRLQSYCTSPGYRITGAGGATTGTQALGWMTASREGASGPSLTVAVRDFWHNFPKAISVSTDGTVAVNLFPNGEQFRHNFRVGEEKTHTILYRFAVGATAANEAERIATAFSNPLFGVAPASWYTAGGALGEVPAADLTQWPLYERYVRVAFEPNPDFDPNVDDPNLGNRTLREMVEQYNFYGWQDYGDVPLDFESFGPNQAGQMNLKYWFLYGMLVQFCRSGDLRWLDLARPGAWHLADVDFLHVPDEGVQHWVHGAYFGHSQHDEPGNINPNRNGNSPSVDLVFGVPDLLLAYYLTGERRFRDTTLEGLESCRNMSQFSDFTRPIFQRERANLIFAYIEGYRQTGDPQWLDELTTIVARTADLSNKQWLTDPAAYGATHPPSDEEGFIRMFQFDQVVWSLGRYMDFCAEYGISDALGVAAALQAYGDFAINFAMEEYPAGSGRAVHWYDYVFADPNNPETNYRDVNNWALVMADALAYAFKHTGQQRFLNAAQMFYATGTIDPFWEGDPSVYATTKDLVNSCNWGLVYMNQSRAAAGTPTPTPEPGTTLTPTPAPGGTPTPAPTGGPTAPPTATPTPGIDETVRGLIASFYELVLGRGPSSGEVDGWQTYVDYVVNFNIDVRFIPREVARLFFLSEEYANRSRADAEFITDCYRVFLDRAPNQTELDNWLAGVWNRSQVMTVFSESEEFANRIQSLFPGLGGNATRCFVTFMYVGLLDRLVDQSGLEYAAGLFDAAYAQGGLASVRAQATQMAREVIQSAEFLSKNPTTAVYVTRFYRAFLGRFPNDAEIAYWSAELDSGRRTTDAVIDLFADSAEFTARLNEYF